MIKGLAITPPVLGRISIGKVVERNGKRIPEKDDQFTITSQVQNKDGWVPHPIDESLRKTGNGKIRSIPVRLLFNDPDLNLRAEYSMFDRNTGRPICVGNGETCRRFTSNGIVTIDCPSPSACELAKSGLCKPYGRLNVQIGDTEELGTFIFRTTGYNSIRTLAARLSYYQAVSGCLLSSMPLELKLRAKSTTQSYRSAIYFVDLTVRDGLTLEEAISQAKQVDAQRKSVGYDQQALDLAAKVGFANSAFEEGDDEVAEIVEEFFTEVNTSNSPPSVTASTLLKKLDAKVASHNGV
ncbi:hydrolase or metal-binding protein [Undibacterium sp. Dicai25W]|uniref:recombination directionality factor n=1 Tax=Undibacterium sp. Dicai25W TaxID=3413034 RepID=UPI003BF25CEB